LGITRDGRFAALTNYREPAAPDTHASRPSRGALVTASLAADDGRLPADLHAAREDYAGFNLLSGPIGGANPRLHFVTNRGEDAANLAPGLYGLSNGAFDAPWPKARALKVALAGLPTDDSVSAAQLGADLLATLVRPDQVASDDALPDTGLGVDIERRLSASFILGENYGTRCSTLLLVDRRGHAHMTEHTFAPDGRQMFVRRYLWRLPDRD
ncbi:MAG: NRDE family protein, partial [Pseudomonadota bacterium]